MKAKVISTLQVLLLFAGMLVMIFPFAWMPWEVQKRTYHVMQGMAGIHPGDPTYNENLDTATYQKTMG